MTVIVEGSQVALNFNLTFDDGTQVDSNEGLEPVEVCVAACVSAAQST